MRYLIEKSFKYIKWNIKKYIFIIFELIICLSLIYTGNNENIAYAKQKNEIESSVFKNGIFISAYAKDSNKTSDTLIDIEKLSLLKDKYKNKFNIYYGYTGKMNLINEENKIITIDILSISDNLFSELYETNRKAETIYCTENLFEELSKSKNLEEFYISPGKIFNLKNVEKVHNTEKNLIMSYNKGLSIDLSKSLIFPILNFETYKLNSSQINFPIIAVKLANIQEVKSLNNLYEDLETLYPQFSFVNSNIYHQFLTGTDHLSSFLKVLVWASKMSLIIIFLGIIGIVFTFISQREKSLIISKIMGASSKVISLEIFIELFMVTIISSIIALGLTYILNQYNSNIYYDIKMELNTLIKAIIYPTIISGIGFMFAYIKINKKINISMLKSEE